MQPVLAVSKAIEGFLLHKRVEGLSPRTLELYDHQLQHFSKHLGEKTLDMVCADDVLKFLDYLKREYKPVRWGGVDSPLSDKSVRNYWIALRSFWSWVADEFLIPSPMATIKAPKAPDVQGEPFTDDEIIKIVAACKRSSKTRWYNHRNLAIVLVLLDTGVRAQELCDLKIGDVDLETGHVVVQHGKGNKPRTVFIGDSTRKALWRYLTTRRDGDDDAQPLFANYRGKTLKRQWLRTMLAIVGEQAGVKDVHPHRFRHTFASLYIEHGDMYSLKELLGHETLEMVARYVKRAKNKLQAAHRRASPVDRLISGNNR